MQFHAGKAAEEGSLVDSATWKLQSVNPSVRLCAATKSAHQQICACVCSMLPHLPPIRVPESRFCPLSCFAPATSFICGQHVHSSMPRPSKKFRSHPFHAPAMAKSTIGRGYLEHPRQALFPHHPNWQQRQYLLSCRQSRFLQHLNAATADTSDQKVPDLVKGSMTMWVCILVRAT